MWVVCRPKEDGQLLYIQETAFEPYGLSNDRADANVVCGAGLIPACHVLVTGLILAKECSRDLWKINI